MKKIILIGGSPTAGKSYTARKLAHDLQLPWISTDTIREQMRGVVRKEDYPNLFRNEDGDAETSWDKAVEVLTRYSAEEMVEREKRQGEEVWKGVRGLIEGDYVWGNFIVEGVAILPHLIANQVWEMEKDIRSLFLIDEDVDRVRNTIFTRGLWDDSDKYPDSVKEKEVEWVLAFNAYIRKEATQYGLPVISVDRKEYLTEIKNLIQ